MTTETTTTEPTFTIEVQNPSFFSKRRLLNKYRDYALGYYKNGGYYIDPVRFTRNDVINTAGMDQTLKIIEAVYGESGVTEAKKIEEQIARDFRVLRAKEAKERN